MSNTVFFDIDGTLVSCQTQEVLAQIMKKKGFIALQDSVYIYIWFVLYKFGVIKDTVKIRKRMYRILARHPKAIIDKCFLDASSLVLETKTKNNMKEIVRKHREQNDSLVAISGSLQPICIQIAKFYGIEQCYATSLICENDKYTGEWQGQIFEGEEKARLIRRIAIEHKIDLSQSSAYGDSFSDLPMLTSVGKPIAVSPDRRLRKVAEAKTWGIIE